MINKKHFALFTAVLLLCGTLMSRAQNVGINATGAEPDASAILDISAGNKGLLIPRVALAATHVSTPVESPAPSLLVYNTASAGSTPYAVTPGYYYWNGTAWVRLLTEASSTASSGWSLTGNRGTLPTTHFIGTSDAADLSIRTNNSERLRVTSGGKVGIGTANPAATLDVQGTAKIGTGGSVLNGIFRTTVTVSDNARIRENETKEITVTVSGVLANASVVVNPRGPLQDGVSLAWCRANATNQITLAFTNTHNSSANVGTVTFDVTIIQ